LAVEVDGERGREGGREGGRGLDMEGQGDGSKEEEKIETSITNDGG